MIEKFETKVKKQLRNFGLMSMLLLSASVPKSSKYPETNPIPKDFLLIDKIDTSCQTVLEWVCQGWPAQCGHFKETEYCPLDSEREGLFIQESLKEGDKAYLINLVINEDLISTWVVDNPEEILQEFENIPKYNKTIYTNYNEKDSE